jgi:hypothetical protein
MDAVGGKVDIAPAQRAQLALPQAAVSGGEVEHGVLLAGGVADERGKLLGVERAELAAVVDVRPVDKVGGRGVPLEAVLAHGVLEDAVRDGQVTYDGPR